MSTDVDFPTNGLDISPFLSPEVRSEYSLDKRRPQLYDLIGVAHHSGSMSGGHYIAHVDTQDYSDRSQRLTDNSCQNWVCFNDARVTKMSPSSIGGPSAYILFYRQRNT